METVLKSELLEFPDNIVNDLRKKYGLEQPGRLEEALDLLEDWYKKQSHFTKKDIDRRFLEMHLIGCKGLVERAKEKIERLCALKTVLPDIFSECKLEEFLIKQSDRKFYDCVLPKMTPNNNRVYILKVMEGPYPEDMFNTIYRQGILLVEYLRMNDYSDGFIVIVDYSKINIFDILAVFNLQQLKNMATILMKGYGFRLNSGHFLLPQSTFGKATELIFGIVKAVLPPKLASRVHMHKSYEELYEYVPQEIMPKDYDGGENFTIAEKKAQTQKVLGSKEHIDHVNTMNEAKVHDYKIQTEQYQEHLGLPGSFRKLVVD